MPNGGELSTVHRCAACEGLSSKGNKATAVSTCVRIEPPKCLCTQCVVHPICCHPEASRPKRRALCGAIIGRVRLASLFAYWFARLNQIFPHVVRTFKTGPPPFNFPSALSDLGPH